MKDIEERKKMANEGWAYSVEKIDLLIISISGGGVFVVLETIKTAFTSIKPIDNIQSLKASGALFVLSMILNICSQFTGKECNYFCVKSCKEELKFKETTTEAEKGNYRLYEKKVKAYGKATKWLNESSLTSMLVALFILIYFFMATF